MLQFSIYSDGFEKLEKELRNRNASGDQCCSKCDDSLQMRLVLLQFIEHYYLACAPPMYKRCSVFWNKRFIHSCRRQGRKLKAISKRSTSKSLKSNSKSSTCRRRIVAEAELGLIGIPNGTNHRSSDDVQGARTPRESKTKAKTCKGLQLTFC